MQTLSAEWRKYTDERTGREVWQITTDDSINQAFYFESQAFTGDERFLVFRSDRGGVSRVWRCDLETGELTCLTPDGSENTRGFSMHPDGRRCFYWRAGRLESADVAVGEPADRIDVNAITGGEVTPFAQSFSADGNRVACAYRNKLGAVLAVVELDRHEVVPVLQWHRFSHPMICPADRDLITFVPSGEPCWNMDLPQSMRTRTWTVRVGEGQPRRFLTPAMGRTITHESWTPDGERLFFYDKTYPAWCPVSVCSIYRDGTDWRVHYTSDELNLGHGVVSPDQRTFLTDVQKANDNPLVLIDLRTAAAEILCYADASNDGGHPECAHVHPSFSPRGTYATYTSDASGRPQVYVVPI